MNFYDDDDDYRDGLYGYSSSRRNYDSLRRSNSSYRSSFLDDYGSNSYSDKASSDKASSDKASSDKSSSGNSSGKSSKEEVEEYKEQISSYESKMISIWKWLCETYGDFETDVYANNLKYNGLVEKKVSEDDMVFEGEGRPHKVSVKSYKKENNMKGGAKDYDSVDKKYKKSLKKNRKYESKTVKNLKRARKFLGYVTASTIGAVVLGIPAFAAIGIGGGVISMSKKIIIKGLLEEKYKDLYEREIKHISINVSADEITIALGTKQYFKFNDKFYIKGTKGRDVLLFENYFDSWFTASKSVDKSEEKDTVLIDIVVTYLNSCFRLANKGIIVDNSENLYQITKKTIPEIISVFKNRKKDNQLESLRKSGILSQGQGDAANNLDKGSKISDAENKFWEDHLDASIYRNISVEALDYPTITKTIEGILKSSESYDSYGQRILSSGQRGLVAKLDRIGLLIKKLQEIEGRELQQLLDTYEKKINSINQSSSIKKNTKSLDSIVDSLEKHSVEFYRFVSDKIKYKFESSQIIGQNERAIFLKALNSSIEDDGSGKIMKSEELYDCNIPLINFKEDSYYRNIIDELLQNGVIKEFIFRLKNIFNDTPKLYKLITESGDTGISDYIKEFDTDDSTSERKINRSFNDIIRYISLQKFGYILNSDSYKYKLYFFNGYDIENNRVQYFGKSCMEKVFNLTSQPPEKDPHPTADGAATETDSDDAGFATSAEEDSDDDDGDDDGDDDDGDDSDESVVDAGGDRLGRAHAEDHVSRRMWKQLSNPVQGIKDSIKRNRALKQQKIDEAQREIDKADAMLEMSESSSPLDINAFSGGGPAPDNNEEYYKTFGYYGSDSPPDIISDTDGNGLMPGIITVNNVPFTTIFIDYINFIFYYNVLKEIIKKRSKLLDKCKDILGEEFSSDKDSDNREDIDNFIKEFGLESLKDELLSLRVMGNLSFFKSVETLKDPDRNTAYLIVTKGKSQKSIENLELAIKFLKGVREDKIKKDKEREERNKKRKAEAEQRKKEQEKKKEDERQRILKLREKMDQEAKIEKEKLDAIKEQEKKEELKGKPDEEIAKPDVKDKEISKEISKKSDSIYEKLFGETSDDVLKKGSYIPSDVKMIQVAEQELNEYKSIRDKLTDQIKKDKMIKAEQINSLRNDVKQRLKELEYIERSDKDNLTAEYRNLLRLKEELEKSGEERLSLIKQRQEVLDKKRDQDLEELNKIYEEYIDKIKYHKSTDKNRYLLDLVNSYDGTSGSMLELKARLQKLVELPISDKRLRNKLTQRKSIYRGKKRTRRKLKRPERGVYAIKDILLS
tara:strand:- start:3891 stop:7814 length:3924 start_codon:yes stop_codon:yes gene_type:complete